MKLLETKNITLLTETETIEAKQLLSKMRHNYCWLYIIPFMLVLTFTLTLFATIQSTETLPIFVILDSICFLALTICIIIYINLLRPYKKLLKIAKHNDLLRHDEKVREAERERLKHEKDTYTKKDIKNTLEKTEI